MRITPHDIRQQQFTIKMIKGYDTGEVEAFLDDVAGDYEALLKEVMLLKEQLVAQEERSRGLVEREKILQDTLVTTQRLTDEMKASAKREADLVVREAELRGEKMLEDARAEEAEIRGDIQSLKRLRRQAVEEVTATLERYQRLLAAEADPGRASVE
jgi:cell division initiation protein